MISTCAEKGCKNLGTHLIHVDLYPPTSSGYEGAPAQIFFPDLAFCEKHAKTLRWNDLILPDAVVSVFQGLGRVAPDFSRTQIHSQVIQGTETV